MEDLIDALGKITRLANRLKNKHPEFFTEKDKTIIILAQEVMKNNSDIKETEKLVKS